MTVIGRLEIRFTHFASEMGGRVVGLVGQASVFEDIGGIVDEGTFVLSAFDHDCSSCWAFTTFISRIGHQGTIQVGVVETLVLRLSRLESTLTCSTNISVVTIAICRQTFVISFIKFEAGFTLGTFWLILSVFVLFGYEFDTIRDLLGSVLTSSYSIVQVMGNSGI